MGAVSLAGETLLLQMSLLDAVSADDVGAAGTGLAVVVFLRQELVVAGPDGSDWLDFLLCQILPDDLHGFIWRQFSFNGGNLVRPFVVILDGL